ncbi:MAG TPA: hypothetical protein VF481_15760 [Novosphingobium sp.]
MAQLLELLFQFIVEAIADTFYSSLSKRGRIGCWLIVAAVVAGLALFIFLR